MQLNQQKGTAQDLSFLKEASPIYVTSLSGNSVTTSSSTTAKGGGTSELIVADSSEYARAQLDHVFRQQQLALKPPGSAQPVVAVAAAAASAGDDVNQNIVNQSKLSAVQSGGGAGGAVSVANLTSAAAPSNNNSSSSSTLNNNLVNSNISGTFNRAGADGTVPCVGLVNLNNNNKNHLSNNNHRALNLNNYYETNNNATGESKYSLANGHSQEVSTSYCIPPIYLSCHCHRPPTREPFARSQSAYHNVKCHFRNQIRQQTFRQRLRVEPKYSWSIKPTDLITGMSGN